MEIFLLSLIGLFTGVIGGMLGVGGGIIMIPAMTELLGPDQHLYQAAAMIVTLFVVVPAVLRHAREGVIDRPSVARIVMVAVPAVLVGVGVSELPVFAGAGEAYLRGVFGAFLLLAGGYEIYRMLRRREPVSPLAVRGASGADRAGAVWLQAPLIAIPTGLVAGLLGVGGGLLAVPLQRRFLKMPMRTAIANSSAIIIATCVVGATAKNYAYFVDKGSIARPVTLAIVRIVFPCAY